jgi:excisionase family DNA binding protein
MSERRWYAIDETADRLRLCRGTVYSLASRGRFPAGSVLRLGRQLRFDIAAIEAGLAVDGERARKGGR